MALPASSGSLSVTVVMRSELSMPMTINTVQLKLVNTDDAERCLLACNDTQLVLLPHASKVTTVPVARTDRTGHPAFWVEQVTLSIKGPSLQLVMTWCVGSDGYPNDASRDGCASDPIPLQPCLQQPVSDVFLCRPLAQVKLSASKHAYPDIASLQAVSWSKLHSHSQALFVNNTNQLALELLAPSTGWFVGQSQLLLLAGLPAALRAHALLSGFLAVYQLERVPLQLSLRNTGDDVTLHTLQVAVHAAVSLTLGKRSREKRGKQCVAPL